MARSRRISIVPWLPRRAQIFLSFFFFFVSRRISQTLASASIQDRATYSTKIPSKMEEGWKKKKETREGEGKRISS